MTRTPLARLDGLAPASTTRPVANHAGRDLLVVFLVAALLTASCGGRSTPGQASPDIPPHIADIIASADGLPAEVLSDGEVTLAEIERSVLAYRACVEDEGVEIDQFDFDPFGLEGDISVSFVGRDSATVVRADEVSRECMAKLYEPVALAYEYLMPESEREMWSDFEKRIVECARAHGLKVDNFNGALRAFTDEMRELCEAVSATR